MTPGWLLLFCTAAAALLADMTSCTLLKTACVFDQLCPAPLAWPTPHCTALLTVPHPAALYCARAELADGQDILELGCGWGSFSLFAAAAYPGSKVTAVSNSRTQVGPVCFEWHFVGLWAEESGCRWESYVLWSRSRVGSIPLR